MGKVAPRRLEKRFYEAECEAGRRGKKYHII